MNSEELFDVVDEEDQVLERLPRSVVHERGLMHRSVHVFVFNTEGLLLIHLRSADKDEYPSLWTSSASGHVSAGESYDDAAPRELAEELGLHEPLTRLAKFPASEQTAREFTMLYELMTDTPPEFDQAEIERIEFRDPLELLHDLRRDPESFSPPFRLLLDWYCRR